jgi:hypothetical protein
MHMMALHSFVVGNTNVLQYFEVDIYVVCIEFADEFINICVAVFI